MQRIQLLILALILPLSLLAQQKTKIKLEDNKTGKLQGEITYLKFPVFRHENATLTADSAVFYENRNVFEAFRNVHINQGDTINIYSDFLTYDGNTKVAHLTSNVRMVDKENVLTTNTLDYNMGSKVGTYVEGGKIVNKDVTLTSKNGYYFSNSRDAYFRYNVLVVSPQSRITSDTLRYNTLSNWAYFYGPTNIKGKDDNLYTENGAYNTKTEYAYFGKKNLYTNASKSLKGDSLYYDGKAGYGKAVKNIVFKDTSDKTVLYGQLGYYYKLGEKAVVTKNAYVGMGTKDSIKVKNNLQPDSLWMGADTLETQMVLRKTLRLISSPTLQKDNELGEAEENSQSRKSATRPKSITGKAPNIPPAIKKPLKAEQKAAKEVVPDTSKNEIPKDSLLKDSIPIKTVAVVAAKDSLKTKTAPSLKITKPIDTTLAKPSIKGAAVAKATANLKRNDTISTNPLDTVKTRVIKAYHNVRVYKTNMQAVADSLFYTAADSTLRWYGKPILWSQGSQQTGDTIFLRLKNNKLKTLQVIQNAFVVNVNSDSAKLFNQVKGKVITGFFTNGELSNLFVDGNAESVYYNRNKDSVYIEMNQTVSSRIKVLFKNKEVSRILAIRDPEGVRTPIAELKEDVKLTGFTWQPKLRILSKKEAINGKLTSKTSPKTSKLTTATKVAPAKKPIITKKNVTSTIKSVIGKNPIPIPAAKDLRQVDSLIKKTDTLLRKKVDPLKK
ncbi:OstA-like protein [Pedobacter sp. JCM 36344]|uniref:OstA-like protein n=1 Tax=Pedobacter sp. JCM 36344 TaxID=3374280 RepID=UPI003979B405